MKKAILTQEEKENIKEILELQNKAGSLKLEIDKKIADFWYNFQSRMGGGSYVLDSQTGEIWEQTFKDRTESRG